MTKRFNTHFIYFWGGPGVGKSTLTADLFQSFKRQGHAVELVPEQAKLWALHGNVLDQEGNLYHQKQMEDQYNGVTQYAICECPWPLCIAYVKRECDKSPESRRKIRALRQNAAERVGASTNFFVQRDPKLRYDNHGRFEDLAQAKVVDQLIVTELRQYKTRFPVRAIHGTWRADPGTFLMFKRDK